MLAEHVLRDLKQSFRILRKNKAFALAALAAITLGIGANTAVFSVVNAVLLRPVAVPDPDRVVFLANVSPQGRGTAASPAKFQHWRSQSDVLTHVSAFRSGVVNFTGGSRPEQIRSLQVSADFFTLFGATVRHGRTFRPDEDLPNGPQVVVINHGLWTRVFDADESVVGRTMSLDGNAYTIVGVLDGFPFREFGQTPDVFTPFQIDPNTGDQGHYFQSAGRLAPGVSIDQAETRLRASADAFRAKFPNALQPEAAFGVTPVREALVANVRTSLFILVGAVSFVLLIACANVANLLLARAAGRTREMAVRVAIGGSRGRLAGQLLTESMVLSLTGGALGVVFGLVGMRALLSINTAGLPRVGAGGALVGADWRVVAFAVAVSVGTGLLFGLIPALQASRNDLAGTLKEGGGRSGSGARHTRTRAVLVVTEVALALVLLVGSALLIRTAVALANVDPGFDTANVLTLRTSLTGSAFQTSAGVAEFVRNASERLLSVPGVEHTSAGCCVPLQGGFGLGFVIAGRPLEGPTHGGAGWMSVSPGYFEVFQIPVRRGRTFTEQDGAGGAPVVIINETMARQFWPDGDPLGERLAIGRAMREFSTEPERQVIGIVGDTRDGGLNADPVPQMFVPQAQIPDAANALNVRLVPMAWFVRTRTAPTPALAQSIEDALSAATGLPVTNRQAMNDIVSVSTSRERFNMWLMSVFGASALLLAAIGIYGLMAYSVAQRTQEIGIRLALGAQAEEVRNTVMFQALRMSLLGIAIGLAAAFGLSRFLASLLYDVSPYDPLVFTAVPAALATVALVAAWLPAVRASRVDPLIALRNE